MQEERHTDGATAAPGMRVTRRAQYATPNDHDQEAYGLRMAKRAPVRRKTKTAGFAEREPVTDSAWNRHFDDAKFFEYLDRRDAGEAFT